ncbi:MAG: glycosyltransferase family 4 protein [Candidatus Angelobacter sp.]
MKIFLVAHGIFPQRGGVELHVYCIAERLCALGHEVCVIVRSGAPSASRNHGMCVVRGATAATVKRLLKTEQPDALHAHGARSMFVARSLLAAKSMGLRTVFTPHCFYPAQDFSGKIKRLIFDKTIGRMVLNASDSIIALTENDFRDAVALGADPARLRIIPNSIEFPHPLSQVEAAAWRKHYGIERFILAVGRLDRVKRGDFLIRALLSLPKDMALVFIGPDAGCRNEWQALATNLGLQGAVYFLGEVSDYDLKAAYQSCSAVALASKYEGLPTVVLESMAMGAPVVAANTGGTGCVVRHGENGFLFSYNDTAGFVAAMHQALAPEASAIVDRARKIVVSEYSWKANIPKICTLYMIKSEMGEGATCVLAQ